MQRRIDAYIRVSVYDAANVLVKSWFNIVLVMLGCCYAAASVIAKIVYFRKKDIV